MYDVLYCADKIEEFLRDLQHERDHGFDGIWFSTVECEDNAISERERERRNSNESDTKTYCSALFSAIIDNMSEQIKTIGMRLFQNLTFSYYFGMPNIMNTKQNFQKIY